MSRTTAVIAATALCACAQPWTRADFSPAQAEQDQTACAEQAERDISLRPAGLLSGSLAEYYGASFQPYARARRIGASGPLFELDPTSFRLEQLRLEDECMRAKGYERRPTS
jgi:hypothetical protein